MIEHDILQRCDLMAWLPNNAIGAEIGVHRGNFALEILDRNRPEKLYLIDPWPDEPLYNGDDMIMGNEAFDFVTKRYADDSRVVVVRDTCVKALPKLGRIFDWVHLDTFHLYPLTALELYACSLAVKTGGFITGHDYDIPSVRRSIDIFCRYLDWEVMFLVGTNPPVSYVLRQL